MSRKAPQPVPPGKVKPSPPPAPPPKRSAEAGRGVQSEPTRLRDRFAGQAMAGLVQDREGQRILRDRCEGDEDLHSKMAEAAYKLADAMLAEREKQS